MDAIALLKTLCDQVTITAQLNETNATMTGYGDFKRASGQVVVEVEGCQRVFLVEIKETHPAIDS
jgi:hypothetical protein